MVGFSRVIVVWTQAAMVRSTDSAFSRLIDPI